MENNMCNLVIDSVVKKMIEKRYEQYCRYDDHSYENLFNDIKNKHIDAMDSLFNKGLINHGYVVVYGEFGNFFYNRYSSLFNIIVVPDTKELDLSYVHDLIKNKLWVFVDLCYHNDPEYDNPKDIVFNEIRRLDGLISTMYTHIDLTIEYKHDIISLYKYTNETYNECKYKCKCGFKFNVPHIYSSLVQTVYMCPLCCEYIECK